MSHLGHRSCELRGGNVSITVAVEGSKNLQELLLVDEDILVHVGHDGGDELVKLDVAVAVVIHVGKEAVELVPGGLDAEGTEERGELQVGEAAIGVHVEAVEYVVELLDLIIGLEH